MPLVLGCISQKGGVGKSTLARLIAREFAAGGWRVKIADLDVSQITSTAWKKRRDCAGIDPEVAVEPFRTVSQALSVRDAYDLLILDGPPHSMAGTKEIARNSDLVVLPTGLSLDDLQPTVLLAHELVDAGIPADRIAFVLSRVGDRQNEIDEARSYIWKAGYFALSGELPEKTAFRRAADEGRALSEVTFPSLKSRAEELAKSVASKLIPDKDNKNSRNKEEAA
jgi:chromosome partitioning protein